MKNEGNQHKNLLQEDSSKVKTSKVETNLNYTKFNQKPEPDEQITNKPKFNYVHYDPEMHWCRVCNVFPTTAKEYLNHLHSAEHKEFILVSFEFTSSVLNKCIKVYNINLLESMCCFVLRVTSS